MEIILMEKVAKLGNLGDKVRVKDGYARNFLIPQGMARRVTEKALADFEARRAELERVQAEKLAAAQALAEKLTQTTLKLARNAGVDGKLFGSVNNFDIAEALKAQGLAVERSQIRMPQGPLKQVGEYELAVALHTDVITTLKLAVVAEQA
jgi:large subunit ribosomal protein L9